MPDDEFSAEDSLAQLRAQVDQMICNSPELARMARGFHKAFMAEGFTPQQALYLTAVQLKDSPGTAP